MRTTITFDDDVAAALERLRRERSIGLSQAVNELIRVGLQPGKANRRRFTQRTQALGLSIDVTNVADALETLEGPSAR